MTIPHRAQLTIDLAAIAENYRRLQRMLGEGTRCGAAIKADCYGLGAAKIARVLAAAGCRDFFVATTSEGIAARAVLDSARIFVLMGPADDDRGAYAAHRLTAVLNTRDQIEEWLARDAAESALPVALHLDTGMTRLGIPLEEIESLLRERKNLQKLKVCHILSHLACSEETENPMNALQRDQFVLLSERLLPLWQPRPERSFSNSSGIYLGRSYHFDIVRPGAALYGLNPTPGHENPMENVVTLEARIQQVRTIDAGRTVGYGATHRFPGPTRVATLAAGYADGIFRSLSNRGAVYVSGHRAPIVGRVSMDLITIDVGHVPEHLTRPGSMVEILGPHQSPDDLALAADTNGYEVLTAFGRRYQRRYLPAP